MYWTVYYRGVGTRQNSQAKIIARVHQCSRIVYMYFSENLIPETLQFFISETTQSIASKLFEM